MWVYHDVIILVLHTGLELEIIVILRFELSASASASTIWYLNLVPNAHYLILTVQRLAHENYIYPPLKSWKVSIMLTEFEK